MAQRYNKMMHSSPLPMAAVAVKTWEVMKDVKASYPVQLAEYAQNYRISTASAVAWWTFDVIKKRNRIISKIKSKYWVKTHKFGIRISKNAKEGQNLDTLNGNTLWWDAICKEMKNVMIAFENMMASYITMVPLRNCRVSDISILIVT